MAKSYNTPEYRMKKRVVSFVNPETKKKILKEAKKLDLTVSKFVSGLLENSLK